MATAEAMTREPPVLPSELRRPDEVALFFSVATAAQTLGVSDDTVYELVRRGELPSLRIGRRRVIPRQAVELVVEHLLADFDPGLLADRLSAEA
jgi:excisionase family DNA binding protein